MSDSIARVSRAFDLIPYILRNPGVSFNELEEKFAINTKELLLELNLIFCCGLPGYTPLELIDISFDDGYVTVTNPQVLTTPRKLTKNELLIISLGLNLLRNSLTEDLKLSCDALINQISNASTATNLNIFTIKKFPFHDKVKNQSLKFFVCDNQKFDDLSSNITYDFNENGFRCDSFSKNSEQNIVFILMKDGTVYGMGDIVELTFKTQKQTFVEKSIMKITYSTNWMGPINLDWIKENGEHWAGGRIDIYGTGEPYGDETNCPIMHAEDYNSLSDWLDTFETDTVWNWVELIREYEKTHSKIRLFHEDDREKVDEE